MLRSESGLLNRSGLLLVLIMGILLVAGVTVFFPVANGIFMLLALVGIMSVILVIHRFQIGILFLFLLSVFMSFVQRTFHTAFPFGIIYDFLIVMIFFSMFFQKREKLNWNNFLNPVTIGFLVLILYNVVEMFNPHGTMLAWAVSFRRYIVFILYIILSQVIIQRRGLEWITKVWLSLAFLIALYGIYQKVFGLSAAETAWIYSSPERVSVYVVWGEMRIFSFLSDPSSYGIFLAYSILYCLIMIIRTPQFKTRAIYSGASLVMLLAMGFSGTRTAYVMIVVGVMFYILLTFRSFKTLAVCSAAALVGLILFFGPFNGWQINRIRSAFQPSDDASMGVRDTKRIDNQPYIRSHPFGGGVYTTAFFGKSYAPGHRFAGFDPDSGYLETALESGWIGLIILFGFMIATMSHGIENYFKIRHDRIKTLVLAHIIPFFAMTVAHYAQNAMFAKPVDMLVTISIAVMVQATLLDKKYEQSELFTHELSHK
ncbi:MAG: O-antigen ligase family protein [Marinoscillum sp.]